MKYSVVLHNKAMEVEISSRATRALAARDKPLFADVHLIFGCMIAKRVWFKDQPDSDDIVYVTDQLGLSFHTVRYDVCSFENIDNGGIPEAFTPGRDISKFMPGYVFIDHKDDKYTGEFNY